MVVLRKGASLIELIIAIVVMSIAMMSLPLMLKRSQEGNAFTMRQEALLAARTQLGDITTYPWDNNSLKALNIGILDVNSTVTPNSLHRNDANSTRRIGHIAQDRRRKFFDPTTPNNSATSPANLGSEGGTIDDIDDFHNTTAQLIASTDLAAAGLDYRFVDLNTTTTVHYISDNTNYQTNAINNFTFGTSNDEEVSGSTNIKLIEVTLRSSSFEGDIILRTYSSNIGESQLLRRDY